MNGYVKMKNIKPIATGNEKDAIVARCKKLFDCYIPGYNPPIWSCDDPSLDLMKQCRVFYDEGSKIVDVMVLVDNREPVNIAMDRLYPQDKLLRQFGYETGYYDICSPEKETLVPPNILVYTPCRVNGFPGKVAHILHAIGLAFDIETQPDYKAYHAPGMDLEIRTKYAVTFYIRMFKKIFKATEKLGKKHLVISLVGGNNYASAWEGGPPQFQKDVWTPAYQKAIEMGYLPDGIKVSIMGARGTYPQKTLQLDDIGYFPACMKRVVVEETVFVNAWDCWSVPGNGNEHDNSLDGFVGRNTDVGVNGTSLTNPWLCDTTNYIPL